MAKRRAKWDFLRDTHGTGLHKLAEVVTNPVLTGRTNEEIIEDIKGEIARIENQDTLSEQDKIELSYLKQIRDVKGIQEEALKFVDQFRSFLNERSQMETFVAFHTEVRLADKLMGSAGTIDLIEEHTNKRLIFYDYKTK